MNEHQSFEFIKLNANIEEKLKKFMNYFALRSGHFDFALTDNGDMFFFECNPDGRWALYDYDKRVSKSYARLLQTIMDQSNED